MYKYININYNINIKYHPSKQLMKMMMKKLGRKGGWMIDRSVVMVVLNNRHSIAEAKSHLHSSSF